MVEVFISLDKICTVVITSRNNIIFYDDYEYEASLLDQLYYLFDSVKPDSAYIVLNPTYDTNVYRHVYITDKVQIGDYVYNGIVSQEDINKLVHLFNVLKIENVYFYDKMHYYTHFLPVNTCGVDYTQGTYTVLCKKNDLFSLSYAKNNVEQMLLQNCRKAHVTEIVDFTSFIDYDCIRWFENSAQIGDINVFIKLSVFGYFRFLNKDDNIEDLVSVKFDRNLNTVTYGTAYVEDPHILKSASVHEATVEEQLQVTAKQTENAAETLVASAKKEPEKKIGAVLTVIMIILLIITLGGAGLYFYLSQQYKSKENQYQISADTYEHEKNIEASLKQILQEDTAVLYDSVASSCDATEIIGSVTFNNDSLEVLFYVPADSDVEKLKSTLAAHFEVNGIADNGKITIGDKIYSKYVISLSEISE